MCWESVAGLHEELQGHALSLCCPIDRPRCRCATPQGTLACIAVLTLLALLAVALAALRWRAAKRGVVQSDSCKAGSSDSRGQIAAAAAGIVPVLFAGSALASLLLLAVSAAARVRAIYQPSVSTTDSLYYSLIVLPELVQQTLVSWPALLHRAGVADAYRDWRTAARPWVLRAFPCGAQNAAAVEAGRGGSGTEASSTAA